MRGLRFFYRSPILILWALVSVNLILAAAVPWALMAMTRRAAFTLMPRLTSPDIAGTLVFVVAELLLLGVWTALYDPRLPVRWLSIIGVIAIGGVVFAGDFNLVLQVFYSDAAYWIEYRYVTVIASSVAFVILGFVLVLAVHCLLWLPRAYLGWRLCFEENSREVPRRQFGMAQGLLWIGLVGALCGVARAFSGQDWFLPAVLAGLFATALAAVLVVPTIWVALRRRRSRLGIFLLAVYVICLSATEGAVGHRLISVPGLFFMTWACLIVLGFNLFVVGVIWFNVWALSSLGVRFVVGKRSNSVAAAPVAVLEKTAV